MADEDETEATEANEEAPALFTGGAGVGYYPSPEEIAQRHRRDSLELAIRMYPQGAGRPETVLEAAQKFYDFVVAEG